MSTATEASSPSSPNISWPLNRPSNPQPWTPADTARLHRTGEANGHPSSTFSTVQPPTSAAQMSPRDYMPAGKRSLAGIAVRAFCLGIALGGSLLLALVLAYNGSRSWRAGAFLATLSTFHFLEFWTTAYANTSQASISSFLLTNGAQYRIAHSAAFVECLMTSLFFPGWQLMFANPVVILVGVLLVAIGQGVRTIAMVQAGTNFDHQVQTRHKQDHVLVTDGMYKYMRHPAYFGFFWWGIGTQIMLGNAICCILYIGVLWSFFSRRIGSEERHLISFFGKSYTEYKARTPTLIPFI